MRLHGPLFPRQLVTHSPTHWITQGALLDMNDAIDKDMNARAGDAELILWLLVLDCAPQHVAKEFRSVMRDTRSQIKLCYVQRNFTVYTQPLDRAYIQELESNFERVNLDSSTAVLRQLLLSFVHTAAQNGDSPQNRATGWRFIDWRWSSVSFSQKQNVFWRTVSTRLSRARCRGHVMEPLADDHSSVEESAAPAVTAALKKAAMSLLERLQASRIIFGSKPPT